MQEPGELWLYMLRSAAFAAGGKEVYGYHAKACRDFTESLPALRKVCENR